WRRRATTRSSSPRASTPPAATDRTGCRTPRCGSARWTGACSSRRTPTRRASSPRSPTRSSISRSAATSCCSATQRQSTIARRSPRSSGSSPRSAPPPGASQARSTRPQRRRCARWESPSSSIFATTSLVSGAFPRMRSLRRAIVVLLAALVSAAVAAAAPPQSRLAAQTNYTKAERPISAIRFVVVHVSEGSFFGTVAWLRDPKAHASANFVVGRNGAVQQLVPLHDIAWHAGNWAYNVRSVGIENEGVTDDPSGFTNAQYRATAKLAAVIARRALIPIDRRHIIGHYQVPDPNDPLQGGGIDNHTDPGKFWR